MTFDMWLFVAFICGLFGVAIGLIIFLEFAHRRDRATQPKGPQS